MAVRSTKEILEAIRERFGDDQSDEAIMLLEDISDTMTDKDTLSAEGAIWKSRYEENDAAWRKKYHDRFFSPEDENGVPEPAKKSEDTTKPLTFDRLFKTE